MVKPAVYNLTLIPMDCGEILQKGGVDQLS